MDVFAYPFRFQTNGMIAKVVQGSDADLAQKLMALVMTEPGELPLAPHFGVIDPSFDELTEGDVAAAAATFYPELSVDSFRLKTIDSGATTVDIQFSNNQEA